MRKLFVTLFLLLSFALQVKAEEANINPEVNANSNAETVTNAETNAEANVNTDNKANADQNANTETEEDAETGADSDIPANTKTKADTDYQEIYRQLPVPTHSYVHGIDPGEYYDTKDTAWSPYPLLRLTSPIFFKTITIEPGYYLLTPRQHEDKWYILFKEEGKIKYIIPVYKRDTTPYRFYEENLPEPKMTWSQRRHINFLKFVGKHFKKSKRKPIPQNYLELFDLDNNFMSMVLYWGDHRYYMIFRAVQL